MDSFSEDGLTKIGRLVGGGRGRQLRKILALAMTTGIVSAAMSQSPTAPEEIQASPNRDVLPFQEGSPGPRVGAAGDMIGFSHSDGSGTQTITLVHTGKSWMAVYHIDVSGTIRLVSSRPIDADFSLQLNATSPMPDEIRQLTHR